jgi:hypothetical protein
MIGLHRRRLILVLAIATIAIAGCQECVLSRAPVLLRNESDQTVRLSILAVTQGGAADIPPGGVDSYSASNGLKGLSVDTWSERSLTMTLSDDVEQSVVIVVTAHAPAFGPTEPTVLDDGGHVATLRNESMHRYRFAVTTDRLIGSAGRALDVLPNESREARILAHDRMIAVDIADIDADRGYRLLFPAGLGEDAEFVVSDGRRMPTPAPLDPELCSLSPAGCSDIQHPASNLRVAPMQLPARRWHTDATPRAPARSPRSVLPGGAP